MNKYILGVISIFLVSMLWSCGSSQPECTEGPSQVDYLVRDMMDEKTFSIVLYDMELDENKDVYHHKYRIVKNIEDSTAKPTITEWKNVDRCFFAENVDNMGLELASKSEDGIVHKIPAPPGYNNAVGNAKYGQWRTDNSGNSFWAFYGQYMFMSTMFHMMAGPPVYRSSYYHYQNYRNDPITRNQPYYGTGANKYGTTSATSRKMNPSFHDKKMSKVTSFKQKVSSDPSRYSRVNSSSKNSNRSTGGSLRSRSGGFGK
jgi:hypothetical protein